MYKCVTIILNLIKALPQTVGLALDGLKQFLLEDMVGGVEGDAHTLTAGGGHW